MIISRTGRIERLAADKTIFSSLAPSNFDALASDRPYRNGFSRSETLEMVSSMSGNALDPRFVGILLDVASEREDFPLHPAWADSSAVP